MARLWRTCFLALVLFGATEAPAFACTCAAIHSFQQRVRAAPVVVVGHVTSVGEVLPSEVESAANVALVRPAFMGAGVTLAIASVAKGEIPARQIRVWDSSYGMCFNALRELTVGTSIVAAILPVSETPATERARWGAASSIPESDFLTSGACGSSVQRLTSAEVTAWIGRTIPQAPAGTVTDDRLPSARIPLLP
jgi:hypothetical protein